MQLKPKQDINKPMQLKVNKLKLVKRELYHVNGSLIIAVLNKEIYFIKLNNCVVVMKSVSLSEAWSAMEKEPQMLKQNDRSILR